MHATMFRKKESLIVNLTTDFGFFNQCVIERERERTVVNFTDCCLSIPTLKFFSIGIPYSASLLTTQYMKCIRSFSLYNIEKISYNKKNLFYFLFQFQSTHFYTTRVLVFFKFLLLLVVHCQSEQCDIVVGLLITLLYQLLLYYMNNNIVLLGTLYMTLVCCVHNSTCCYR